MKLNLKMTYKEYLASKNVRPLVDNIAIALTDLQYDFGDENTFGKLITSDIANSINRMLPFVIPEEQYEKYNALSNNAKRKILIQGVVGAFRNKLVFDKASLSKKSADKKYYTELKITSWDLLKQIHLAIIDKVIVDKNTNIITIK